MSKPAFTFIRKNRKNNVTIAVHAGPAGKTPKYVGTLTFDDQLPAEALLGAVRDLKLPHAEFRVED